jgi:hypothetical protein
VSVSGEQDGLRRWLDDDDSESQADKARKWDQIRAAWGTHDVDWDNDSRDLMAILTAEGAEDRVRAFWERIRHADGLVTRAESPADDGSAPR